MRALLVLVVLLPLAGCLGPEAPEETPAPAADAPTAPEAPREASDAAPGEAVTLAVEVPFSYEGSTGSVVCPLPVRAALDHCASLQPARGEAPEVSVPTPRRLVATLSADAHPAGGPFYVSLLVDLGEGWTWDPAREPSHQGEPPLEVDWDLSHYPAEARFRFYVESSRAAGPFHVGIDRAYAVKGVLSGLAPS